MTCLCAATLDAALKDKNCRLSGAFTVDQKGAGSGFFPFTIRTERLKPGGKRMPLVIASYCPMCGAKIKGEK